MSTIKFDTPAFVKRLIAARMPESRAATKADLLFLEQRITIKLGGLMVAATGLILVGIKYLH